jgi:uncharacterized protein (DUF2461 family)
MTMGPDTRFAGFPNEAFDFFAQLAPHNERAWPQVDAYVEPHR